VSGNELHFNFMATGIGSVPFMDVDSTCRSILEHLPSIPFWPQLVKRSHLEDMIIQYSEGLPLLEIIEEKRALVISNQDSPESELVTFYDHFLARDIDHFAMSREHAPGLYAMAELIGRKNDAHEYIKGHSTGPVTFAAAITDLNGNSVLHNRELLDAMVSGLSIKALWQIRELERTGRKTIIFLDEPYLSGFGSAFSPVERDEVIRVLRAVIDYLRAETNTLIGIHCCGNTDWSMIVDAGPDIINFDAYEYLDYFLLYPDHLTAFIEGGGIVAWGIVPTSNAVGDETVEGLFSKLQGGLERMREWGIDRDLLASRSILTPACGMGSMTPEAAENALSLLLRLSQKCSSPS
jgi:methionine synthase II (cobalamin-independent)